jgi:hypothetical protein
MKALAPSVAASAKGQNESKKAGEKAPCKYSVICYLEGVNRHKGGIA